MDKRRDSTAKETADVLQAGRDRAVGLFAWLDDIGRYGGGPSMLRPAWARLAELLECMARTEQASTVQARRAREAARVAVRTWPDDVRAAVLAAQLHDPGSAAWWKGVHAARSACGHGFSASSERP